MSFVSRPAGLASFAIGVGALLLVASSATNAARAAPWPAAAPDPNDELAAHDE